MGFDFIVVVPLLQSCCGFFFVFGHGVFFWGGVGSSILLPMVVQQLVVTLVLSQDEMSARSSTLPSETGKTTFNLITHFQTMK